MARDPEPGIVDLYHLDMDQPSRDDCDRLLDDLVADEVERANRFHRDLHRRRFILGRAALRGLLSAIAGCHPAQLPLRYTPAGKPFLAAGPSFNVSHSEQHLFIGLARDGALGVDVEVKTTMPDVLSLAATQCSRDERRVLMDLSAAEQSAAFLRLWTRKEALLKAYGTGLCLPLQQLSMEIVSHRGNLFRASSLPGLDPSGWSVQDIVLHPMLQAAVAWNRPAFSVFLTPGNPHLT